MFSEIIVSENIPEIMQVKKHIVLRNENLEKERIQIIYVRISKQKLLS